MKSTPLLPNISLINSCSSYSGSASLQFIFTFGAGLLFSLLVFDLSSYARHNAAAIDGLKAALRCVSPVSANCREGISPNLTTQNINWFGYPKEEGNDLFYLREVTYSPTITETFWESSINTFNVPGGDVTASWQQYSIPRRRFVARLNSWVDTWAPVNEIWYVWDQSQENSDDKKPIRKFSYRLQGPKMYIPHGVEHGNHFTKSVNGSSAVDALTSESWCLESHIPSYEDLNNNNVPDEIDNFLNQNQNLSTSRTCELEHDDFSWTQTANCSWEGREELDERYGTSSSPYFNSVSEPSKEFSTFLNPEGVLQNLDSDNKRPQAIVSEPQYLVLDIVGCSEGVLERLNTSLKDIESISKTFSHNKSGPTFSTPWRDSLVESGYLDENNSSYTRKGVILDNKTPKRANIISSPDWTYLISENPKTSKGENGTTIKRELCTNWVEVNDELKQRALFSEILNKEFSNKLLLGKELAQLPEPIQVNYTELSCAKKIEQKAQFTCSDQKIGCLPLTPQTSCPNLSEHLNKLRLNTLSLLSNQEDTTGYSSEIWDILNFNPEENLNKTKIIPSLKEILFNEAKNKTYSSFSNQSCEGKEALKSELVLSFDKNSHSACLSKKDKKIKKPIEDDWLNLLKQNSSDINDLEKAKLSSLKNNAKLISKEKIIPISDPRELPNGIEGTYFTQGKLDASCNLVSDCKNTNSIFKSEEKAIQILLEKKYGEKYSECIINGMGKEEGPLHLLNANKIDSCLPLVTQCQNEQPRAGSVPTFVATQNQIPAVCKENGSFTNCYSTAELDNLKPLEETDNLNLSLAKEIGYKEFSKISQGAILKNNCGKTADCAEIELKLKDNQQVEAVINYNLKLSPLLSAILRKDYIRINHQKIAKIEG